MNANPFFYGGALTNPRYFVGRREVLERLFAALSTLPGGQAQHVSVYGPYRIGKSSLLYRVRQTAAARGLADHLCFYLDGKRLTNPQSFYAAVLHELEQAGEASTAAVDEALRRLPRPPILLLDEVDALANRDDVFGDDFFDVLRAWMNESLLAMVAASRRPLSEIARGTHLTSPFFNIFGTRLKLEPFTEAEAEELLRRGRECDRPFTADEIRRIKRWAREGHGYHPAKLQLAARELYNAKARPPVVWKTLERRLDAEWAGVEGCLPRSQRLLAAAQRVEKWPAPLGRAVLEMVGRKQISPTTAVIAGWLLVCCFAAVLLGWLPWKIWLLSVLKWLGLGA